MGYTSYCSNCRETVNGVESARRKWSSGYDWVDYVCPRCGTYLGGKEERGSTTGEKGNPCIVRNNLGFLYQWIEETPPDL